MPKEKVSFNDEETAEVIWSRTGEYIQIGVTIPEDIVIISEYNGHKDAEVANGLYVTLGDKKDFDKLMKVLKRAGKQAFSDS